MQERDPELERNFIIFMVLVMLCLFGWMFIMGKKTPPAQEKPSVPEKVVQEAKPVEEVNKAVETTGKAMPEKVKALPANARVSIEEKTVEVKSPLYRIVFTNRGAVPVSWELLRYYDRVYFPYEVSLKWPPFRKVEKFNPKQVQLIENASVKKFPLSTVITLNGMEIGEDALWEVDVKELMVEGEPKRLVFRLPIENGAVLKKIFTFYPDAYRSELRIEYEGIEPDPKQSSVVVELSYVFEPLSRLARINFHGPLVHTNKKLVRFNLKDLNKEKVKSESGVDWAGFTDSYFLSAVLAPMDSPCTVSAYYAGTEDALKDKNSTKQYGMQIKFLPSAKSISENALMASELYFGPKQKDLLEKTRTTLGLAIDYGTWLAVIAIPLMYVLLYINKVLHNFGWSIIILTIILRMATFPLTRKSQKSMKEMQKIQPEIEKIRKKYPDDRMKQQEEIYALQRKYKINPLGGCLPMLIQIPIFFAFYKVLLVSIELRHAPWILWIPDLSSRDPLLILPLFMGISQFLMQKLTPTTSMDPTQAKMLMIMPLVFTLLLVYFPSGLLLYWTVSNIVGIAQQIYVNKTTK